MSKKKGITFEKPVVRTVRIRVQNVEGNKMLDSKTFTLYGTDADTEYARIVELYEKLTGETKEKPAPAEKAASEPSE